MIADAVAEALRGAEWTRAGLRHAAQVARRALPGVPFAEIRREVGKQVADARDEDEVLMMAVI